VFALCGIFYGRAYTRQVVPSADVTFDSGTCDSHTWFDSAENPRCPFADSCGAYARTKAAA
jgi:hypothetical protein